MESHTSPQTSENPTDASVGHVVFGQSLKMHALRHVLLTLEFQLVEPEAAVVSSSVLRVAFDSCDPEACAAKAVFARSWQNKGASLEFLGVGRAPRLQPLLGSTERAPNHQGSIFDPTVEVFRERWGSSLHRVARFTEKRGLESQTQWLSSAAEPFIAARSLEEMLRYASTHNEEAVVRGLISAVQGLETLLAGWAEMARSGDEQVKQQLAAWSRLTSAGAGLAPAGALHTFRELVCGLGLYGHFETAVAELAVTPVATLIGWKEQLDRLK